jgi:hypothetical protein
MRRGDLKKNPKSACAPCCEILKSNSTISYSCWLFGNKFETAHADLSEAVYLLHKAVGNGAMNTLESVFATAQ